MSPVSSAKLQIAYSVPLKAATCSRRRGVNSTSLWATKCQEPGMQSRQLTLRLSAVSIYRPRTIIHLLSTKTSRFSKQTSQWIEAWSHKNRTNHSTASSQQWRVSSINWEYQKTIQRKMQCLFNHKPKTNITEGNLWTTWQISKLSSLARSKRTRRWKTTQK